MSIITKAKALGIVTAETVVDNKLTRTVGTKARNTKKRLKLTEESILEAKRIRDEEVAREIARQEAEAEARQAVIKPDHVAPPA